MGFLQNPRWFDARNRQAQLDEHVRKTRKAQFGVRTFHEREKCRAVMRHFNRVAPKYDFMNSLLSLGIQHVWKRAAIRMLDIRRGERILDICGGTGDLTILAARRAGAQGQVVIYDINRAMMAAGRHKIDPFPALSHIQYVQGDAEKIAFPDRSFDVAMVGFGIRNLTHPKQGFSEIYRVLKPGGRMLCLEFSRPTNPLFRLLYDFYSFYIMPLLGQLIIGSAQSYVCLPETIRMFPLPDELSSILAEIGFNPVRYRRMTNSIAVAHLGVRPRAEIIIPTCLTFSP